MGAWAKRIIAMAALAAGVPLVHASPDATPVTAIALPGDRLHPESVSILSGIAYISSMSGGVLRVSLRSGRVESWIAPGAFGSGAQFGVLADPRNHMLWTCTNEYPGTAVVVPGANPGSWLKGFDLGRGKGKISLKLPGDKPTCNDIAVGRDGAVYVTDTGNPRILRWQPGERALAIWADNPLFGPEPTHSGLDGIAIGGDGNIYVNNVRTGALYRVAMNPDGSAGAVTALTLSRPLGKPDGMRPLAGMDFLLAEGEGRIDRLSIKGDRVEVRTLTDGLVQSTGVDVDGGTAWYVQAYLGALFNRPNAPKPALPFHLTPVALRP
jgi:sugar lactone lactonase YvrE